MRAAWIRISLFTLCVTALAGCAEASGQPQRQAVHSAPAGALAGGETVQVATLNNFPPFSFAVRGKLMGFTIDYLDLLEQKTGLRFAVQGGTWKENLTKFKNGAVEVISAMSYLEKRREFTRFTDPYYIIPTVVYVRENDLAYNGVEDLRGKTVGIESGVFYKAFLDQYPEISIQEIEDTNDLMRQLSFSEIDAVITNINIGNYMIKKHMLENVELAGRIDISGIKDEDLRFGVRKERSRLHTLIQEGLHRITPGEYKALQDRWVGFSPEELFQGDLLPAEFELIKQHERRHGGLRLASQGDWAPVDFLGPEGGHTGVAADIFARVAEKQGLDFRLAKSASLKEAVLAVSRDQAELIPAVVPRHELRQRLSFTKPYLSLPLVIATRNKEIFIDDLEVLEDKRIGYSRESVLNSIRPEAYPDLHFVKAGSPREGLNDVLKRRTFAFIGTIPGITHAIQKHEFYEIKVAGALPEKLPIAAAVAKGDAALLSAVQKGLAALPLQERERIVDSWVSVRFEEHVDYLLVWAVAGVAGCIVLGAVLWSRKVQAFNAQISRANRLLAEKNQELERISISDSLTGLSNRGRLESELERERLRASRQGHGFAIIVLDIDSFKAINDTYGHLAGDKVLKEVAGLIAGRVRATDVPGRWGGEEFLVLCPGTDRCGAGRLGEDIRRAIQDHGFEVGTMVTVSAGVADSTEVAGGSETLVRLADQRLYKAKERRNAVVGW